MARAPRTSRASRGLWPVLEARGTLAKLLEALESARNGQFENEVGHPTPYVPPTEQGSRRLQRLWNNVITDAHCAARKDLTRPSTTLVHGVLVASAVCLGKEGAGVAAAAVTSTAFEVPAECHARGSGACRCGSSTTSDSLDKLPPSLRKNLAALEVCPGGRCRG
jgi:hypothetical protein